MRERVSEESILRGMHAPEGLAAARQALVLWVREAGGMGRIFLQALITLTEGGYSVRHVEDRSVPAERLERFDDPFRARIIAQTTDDGSHRPLKTAPDLRRGWLFEALDERGLWTVLDYLYPACVGHWHAGRQGSLRVTHWNATAARQSGMYSPVRLLSPEVVRDTVVACCGDAVCLRQVAWGLSADDPQPLPSELPGEAEEEVGTRGARVPCPEACSIFVSFARAVLRVERAPRSEVPGLGQVNETEVEQIRSLVAAAAEGPVEHPREGEFDLPLNRRRLRYLSVRLGGAESAGQSAEEEV